MGKNVPMFIVGNSLGANLVTKYLGEEGSSGTLPECVAGGVSLGNPLIIDSGSTEFPMGHLLALGVKKSVVENWKQLHSMKKGDAHYRDVIRRAIFAGTIGEFDEAVASVCVRNHPFYPFSFRIGYKNGKSYWTDASSYRLIRYISVPLLQLTAKDDFLVGRPSTSKLTYSLQNPNVMVVNTRCGGHLGWQESPPDTGNIFGFGTSWADAASADFIQAIINKKREQLVTKSPDNVQERHVPMKDGDALGDDAPVPVGSIETPALEESMIRSRL
jgi:predicted alpha/beta-fold hydrolase